MTTQEHVAEIMAELRTLGQPNIKKILQNHGGPDDTLLGVKVEDLKKMQKKIEKLSKKNHALSLELYDTGISDAMYLAGLIADEKAITREDLDHWARGATWNMIAEYTVPWIAAESPYGLEMGLKWIDSPEETVASAGWATLSNVVALVPDDKLDLALLQRLMARVEKSIHQSQNRVRYTMNGFVISVGRYVVPLHQEALDTARAYGKVEVNLGNTSCKVPSVPEYVEKVRARGSLGKKKKMARC